MSFLEEPPKRKLPAWLVAGRKRMLAGVGKPCKAYNPACINCRVWSAFVELEEFFDER